MIEQMKRGGIDWLGDIPESWDVVRIKDIGTYRNGLTYAPEDIAEDDNGILVLRSSNIQNGKISYDDNVYVKCSVSPELMVKKGDIIICSRNGSRELIGKNAIIENFDLACSFGAFMMVYRCSCPRYMYYILNSEVFSYYLGTFLTSTINQLTGNNFGNMKIAFCKDCNEQNRIVDFLDKECAQIDSIVADLEKQITLLQQYKKSLITETVTKGLDKSVPMQDSGVVWIGEIPDHWKVIRITKYLDSLVDYRGKTPEKTNEGVFLVTARNIKNGIINYSLSQEFVSPEDYEQIMRRGKPHIGDVLFTMEAPLGEVANVDHTNIALAQRVIKLRGRKNTLNNYFLKYWIMSLGFQSFLWSLATGSTALGIAASKLGELKMVLPPIEEQNRISKFLDEKVIIIDSVIEQKEKQLKTIQLYKKSLIYEYVTGKKRVKEVQ